MAAFRGASFLFSRDGPHLEALGWDGGAQAAEAHGAANGISPNNSQGTSNNGPCFVLPSHPAQRLDLAPERGLSSDRLTLLGAILGAPKPKRRSETTIQTVFFRP